LTELIPFNIAVPDWMKYGRCLTG